MDDLSAQMQKLSEPEPHWAGPIAIVMALLCIEALMGSLSNLWKPMKPREILKKLVPAGAA
jgi:hypothetical protein